MNSKSMMNLISTKKAIFKKEYLGSQMRLVSAMMTSDQQTIINKLIGTFLLDLIYKNEFKCTGEFNILALTTHDPFLKIICDILEQHYSECTLMVHSYENSHKKSDKDFKYQIYQLQVDEGISCDLCSSYVALSEDFVHGFCEGFLCDLPTYKDERGILHISILSLLLRISKRVDVDYDKISCACDKALKDTQTGVSHGNDDSTFVRFQSPGSINFETLPISDSNKLYLPSIVPPSMVRRSEQVAVVYKKQSNSNWSELPFNCKNVRYTVSEKDISSDMLYAYLNRGGGGNTVISAVISGAGCRHSYAEDYKGFTEGVPVCWGVLRNSKKIVDDAISRDQHFVYIDHAYFNRGHGNSYRISINSFECNMLRLCPSSRSKQLNVSLDPWNTRGEKIIVCPPTDYFSEAHSVHGWLDKTINEIKLYTDRKIVVRKKPKPDEKPIPLAEQLHEAHALVTHSSNVAIEAVCLGTPVFVSKTSAAAPIGLTDLSMIENPIYPDRSLWINNLSYCQFTLSEIESGNFLHIMNEYYGYNLAPEAID